MGKIKTITIGELRRTLEGLLALEDDAEVFFGGGDLSFYRVKNRSALGPTATPLYQIEFSELYEITMDPDSEN